MGEVWEAFDGEESLWSVYSRVHSDGISKHEVCVHFMCQSGARSSHELGGQGVMGVSRGKCCGEGSIRNRGDIRLRPQRARE